MFVKLLDTRCKPVRKTPGSSGFDLKARVEHTTVIRPNQTTTIPLGFKISLPMGKELQIRSRSGMSLKGLCIANQPGTVDSDFRGEVTAIMINNSNSDFLINPYDRICQGVICDVDMSDLEFVDELDNTVRGEGKFGHTGV